MGPLGEPGTANRRAGARRGTASRGRTGGRRAGPVRGEGCRPRARRIRAAAAAAVAAIRRRRARSMKWRPSVRWPRCCHTATRRMRSRSRGAAGAAWPPRCSAPMMPSPRRIVLGLAPYHGRILVVNQQLREGIHGPWLAAGAADPRRPGPRRRRRGDGRHSRRAALHAAHRGAGLARRHHRHQRALGARQPAARSGTASVSHSLQRTRVGRHAEVGRARSDRCRHRTIRGAVGRQFLRAHERERTRRAIPCSAAASRTAIF